MHLYECMSLGGSDRACSCHFDRMFLYISVCCVCCRMTVIVKEESLTLYKDQNVFTAVVLIPGTNAVFRQVAVNDFSNL